MEVLDRFPPTLLYNSTAEPLGSPVITEGKKVPSVPMGDNELIVLGGRYKDRRGIVVTMNRELPLDAPEYEYGYRFVSDRHVYYRDNGATLVGKERSVVDDLVERCID